MSGDAHAADVGPTVRSAEPLEPFSSWSIAMERASSMLIGRESQSTKHWPTAPG